MIGERPCFKFVLKDDDNTLLPNMQFCLLRNKKNNVMVLEKDLFWFCRGTRYGGGGGFGMWGHGVDIWELARWGGVTQGYEQGGVSGCVRTCTTCLQKVYPNRVLVRTISGSVVTKLQNKVNGTKCVHKNVVNARPNKWQGFH